MLFQGKQYSRSEMLRRVGDISQIASVTAYDLTDGPEKGVGALDVRAGALRFTVLPGRGMDIGYASYNGTPIPFITGSGFQHAAFYEPQGLGWLRGFYSGLLTTCGLTTAGAPSVDGGNALGLHGRVSYTPARAVSYSGRWDGDEYILTVTGIVREVTLFGENVQLTRTITVRAGDPSFSIHDAVENLGFTRTEHMLLYHINIGFPIVDAAARLSAPIMKTHPRDAAAAKGISEFDRMSGPAAGFQEQCFYHEMKPGNVRVVLQNAALLGGFGVYVSYDTRELPSFTEWKMLGEGTYVVGLEPGNCRVEGRAKERERGTLQYLAPGEKREYHLEIGVCGSAVKP